MINGCDLIVASVTQGLNCLGEYMRGFEDWRRHCRRQELGDHGCLFTAKGVRRRGVRRGGEGMRILGRTLGGSQVPQRSAACWYLPSPCRGQPVWTGAKLRVPLTTAKKSFRKKIAEPARDTFHNLFCFNVVDYT